jgi:nucleoside-diphosphate-sugar epimerase
MKRILVTGASGFIGLEVARQLSASGLRPRLLVRRPLRGALLAPMEAEFVQGDLKSPESLERAVQGIDTIFHLGARATFESYTVLKPTIVTGSITLMEAALRAGVQHFIYAGSVFVYDSQHNPIDDKTPATSNLGYGKAKRETEEKLKTLAETSGLGFASIRLPHVYGAGDLIFAQIRSGKAIFPGTGNNLYSHLHIEDAARILIRVGEKKWTGITPVADEEPATWNEFFSTVKIYYPRLRLLRIPKFMALLGTHMLSLQTRFRLRPFLYTPDAVKGANRTIKIKKGLLWDELDLKAKFPTIHRGIPAVLDACVPFRWIHPLMDKS